MQVLITGATGFTGSHLTRELVARGACVRILARPQSDVAQFQDIEVEVAYGDICDPKAVERAVQGCDVVYHLAANYRTAGVPDAVYQQIHVEGTRHVVQACLQHGVQRLIHCSTVGVHGHIPHPPATEEAPYAPGDRYQETKLEGEKIVCRAMREHGLPAVVFRPAGIYGPGDRRFLKLFKAIYRRRFAMLGRGEVLYHLTYISDLIDGILLCGTRPEALGQVYILAGATYSTLTALTQLIAHALQAPAPRWRLPIWPVYGAAVACEFLCKPLRIEPPLYRRRMDFFRKSRAFDIAKARKELGFSPRVDPPEGVRLTAAWYKQQGWL